MTKMLKSIIAGAAVLIGACFIGQTQPVQAADDYALRLAEDTGSMGLFTRLSVEWQT